MRPPRTVLALGLAGLCTAGLGGGVLSAHAEIRTFEVTLGTVERFTVTVDVPAGQGAMAAILGIEDAGDIIEDLKGALAAARSGA